MKYDFDVGFFFSSRRRHTRFDCDWSSDVCSSDLQYDGIIAGNPGTRLPLAAIANIAGAQGYAKLATTTQDLGTGFTQAERRLVSQAVLARCDALDGATDGMVQAGARSEERRVGKECRSRW